jgi:predicted phage-related endonuclease
VTGRRVRRVGMLRHRDFPFVIGHPDRLVIGERRGLEIKTAGYWVGESDAWGEPGTDEIPAAYLLQCMHYMAITGYPVWDVAVLVAGNRYRPYTVQRDDELIAAMLTRYCQTWHCVQTGEIPPVSATAEEALLKYPVAQPTPIEASEDVARAARDYCAAKDLASVAEAEVKRTYPIIADYMGVNDTLTWRGVPVLTWKNRSTGNRLDVKAHAAARPDCHAKFTRSGQTRAMLRKGEIVL